MTDARFRRELQRHGARPASEKLRFAPSATGRAHLGTLLAALLCWLDARSRGAEVLLRIEDLDPERVRPEWVSGLCDDLAWLGLDWDQTVRQSESAEAHGAALDRLEQAGVLYPCACTRRELRGRAERAPDGSFRYPGTCRQRTLGAGGWRSSEEVLRVRLCRRDFDPCDEAARARAGDPSELFGDPVVRRRDGAIAYHLASVVDDATAGVTRVVRGRDLAPSTLVQLALQHLLRLPRPSYRHHLLLLEATGGKLAKLHGSIAVPTLKSRLAPEVVCGFLASILGLVPSGATLRPGDLVSGFSWQRVDDRDRRVIWDGAVLHADLPVAID